MLILLIASLSLFSQGKYQQLMLGDTITVSGIGPVDIFTDLSCTTNGTTLTNGLLNTAGCTHGIGNTNNWALTGTAPVAVTHKTGCSLGGSVQALGTIYPTSNTALAIAFDNTATGNYASLASPMQVASGYARVSFLTCFVPSSVTVTGNMDIIKITGTSGHAIYAQFTPVNCGGTTKFDLETVDTTGVDTSTCSATPSAGSAYWLLLQMDYPNQVATLKVYDSTFTLLSTLSPTRAITFSAGETFSSVRIGNESTGTSSGTNAFENTMVRWSGNSPYPLGPVSTTQTDSVYWVTQSHNNKTSAGTTVATTLALEEQSGDAVVVTCSNENASGQTTGVTNTAGETFTAAAAVKSAANGQSISQWITFPSSNHTSQLYTCTFPSSSFSNVDVQIIHGATSYDTGAVGNTASGANITSGSFTPSTSTGSNVACAYLQAGQNNTTGTNYFMLMSSATNSMGCQFRGSAPNSSQTASMTHASTAASMIVVGNYKP